MSDGVNDSDADRSEITPIREGDPQIDTIFEKLTSREQSVAMLLAVGWKNSAIAKQLDISIKTADTHRGHILKKLQLANNVELAHLALTRGWVKPLDFEYEA